MKQLKKLPLMGLLVMLLVGVFALPVSAEDNKCGDNLSYELNDITGTLTISGTGEMYDFASETAVPWYGNREKITTLVIDSGVTSISYLAFYECKNIKSINLPSTVTSLGKGAFNQCTGLTEIESFGGVTAIGDYAFRGCKNLKSIDIPDTVISLGTKAFENCTGLTEIESFGGVTAIGEGAFSGCENLKSIDIPATVTSLGKGAFDGCSELIEIKSFGGVTVINDDAFKDCIRLKSITIPDTVVSLGQGAFKGCIGLTEIKSFGGAIIIGDNAFSGCTSLKSVVLPDTVTTLSKEAFNGCTELKSINLPSGVVTIAKDAFVGCHKDMVIYCDAGSVAEDFAKENGYTFKIRVATLSLNKESTSLAVGAKETLTVTIAPDNADNKVLTWTSDNTKVASVENNGEVTGVAPGFAIITATTADGGKTAACKVKVTGPVEEFTDVASNAWYAPYVYDLVGLGIINGKGNGLFDPQGKITRAEFAKILATASGDDLAQYEGKTSFGDVVTGKWYSNPIEWAYQNGIVQGKGEGIYAPNDNISRQDMSVMIMRYAKYKGITLPETKPAVTFADDSEIGVWAKDAVAAMQKAGIIEGKGNNLFAPRDNATRAEAAKMISVFLNM